MQRSKADTNPTADTFGLLYFQSRGFTRVGESKPDSLDPCAPPLSTRTRIVFSRRTGNEIRCGEMRRDPVPLGVLCRSRARKSPEAISALRTMTGRSSLASPSICRPPIVIEHSISQYLGVNWGRASPNSPIVSAAPQIVHQPGPQIDAPLGICHRSPSSSGDGRGSVVSGSAAPGPPQFPV